MYYNDDYFGGQIQQLAPLPQVQMPQSQGFSPMDLLRMKQMMGGGAAETPTTDAIEAQSFQDIGQGQAVNPFSQGATGAEAVGQFADVNPFSQAATGTEQFMPQTNPFGLEAVALAAPEPAAAPAEQFKPSGGFPDNPLGFLASGALSGNRFALLYENMPHLVGFGQ